MRPILPAVSSPVGYGINLGAATSDRADLALGRVPPALSNVTCLAIAKRNTPGTVSPHFFAIGTNDKFNFYCRSSAGGNWIALWNGAAQVNSGVTFTDTDGWALVGAHKASGTSAVVGHKYVYSTGVWTHAGSATAVDGAAVTGGNILGNNNGFASSWQGDLALAAIWGRVLTQGEIEALAKASLDEWLRTGPAALWVPRADEPVQDLTGHGAVEILRTGTKPAVSFAPVVMTWTIARPLPVATAGGTTFTDTGAGQIRLSGSESEASTIADIAAGQIRLSGSASESASIANSTAGLVRLQGSTTDLLRYTDTAAGQIRLSGSATDLLGIGYLDSQAGQVRLSGSRADALTVTNTAAGQIRFTGSLAESASIADSRAGRIVLSGTATENNFFSGAVSYTDSGTGTLRLSGVAAAEGQYVTPTQAPGFYVDRGWGRHDHGLGMFWDGRE